MTINLIPEWEHPTYATGGAYIDEEGLHYDCELDRNIQRLNIIHEIIEYKLPMLDHQFIDEFAELIDEVLGKWEGM